MSTSNNKNQDLITDLIWKTKYRYQNEYTLSETFQRVASHIAKCEIHSDKWTQVFFKLLENKKFIPGGRILANAGTSRHATLINCFVMGEVEDSIEGIFEALKEGALTMQMGGGVGYDFSPIRPAMSDALGSGNQSTGPISFMRIWDVMCETMLSSSARRGAMMATLACDHPDIEDFISAKSKGGELTNFNLSVLISDKFLEAVNEDANWDLVFPRGGKIYKTMKAKVLWEKILKHTYDYSEPGVLFIDRINKKNNLNYFEKIYATNPCGELPLPPYGACNLGSMDLSKFVKEPFENPHFDWIEFAELIPVAVRFLDNVVDTSEYPLIQQKEKALSTRRLGLGITGLADMLVMMNLNYSSPEAHELVEKIMQSLCWNAYQASIELAKEKGKFPKFTQKYLNSEFIHSLPHNIQQEIKTHGIRNSHILSIAPTGTISLLAGNVSSGIEPIFSLEQKRVIITNNELNRPQKNEFNLKDYAFELWQKKNANKNNPNFCIAFDLSPKQHLEMVALLQKYVDSSISKTINIPENYSFDEFKSVYDLAYRLGTKGCTTYRPTQMRSQVLSLPKCEGEC